MINTIYFRCRLWWLLLPGMLLFATPQPAIAQASVLQPVTTLTSLHCVTLDNGGSYYLAETRQLTQEIPERVSSTPNAGVFYLDAVFTPPLQQSQRVLLSGSEIGSGFVVDDILNLEVIPGNQSRTWDFRSSDWMQIIPIEQPADITNLFLPDRYHMITATMQDVLTPNYRTSDLWLLTYSPCDWLTATPASTETHVATPLPPTEPTTATRTPVPTVTTTATLAAPASLQNGAIVDESSETPSRSLRLWLISLTAIGTLLSAYALVRMKLYRLLPSFVRCRGYLGSLWLRLRTKWQEIKAVIDAEMKK